ncbi:ATP-dependent DNA helicase II subunit 1 [Purpureocillium lilacinum]|uniref:ATP-dependent DNA helicase II subunit 1 n=1 Tax=Purpureocillium lilacinum TaxID=33203 RepID=UPI0020873086|nr:ATP-dependent DNA helicase II subunit 1 [Purpureocillium lilacinum]
MAEAAKQPPVSAPTGASQGARVAPPTPVATPAGRPATGASPGLANASACANTFASGSPATPASTLVAGTARKSLASSPYQQQESHRNQQLRPRRGPLQRRHPRLVYPPSPRSPASSPLPPRPHTGASPSDQQEPGARSYLERLLRVVQSACAAPRQRDMADFLASFNFGAAEALPAEPSACDSVEELQLRLHEVLEAKTSPTRAEHVATTIDLAAGAHLTLGVSQTENDALEGLSNVDPSLAGMASSGGGDGQQAALTRTVRVSDAISNQPQNDPVLQRAIAKYIIAAVSAADGSTWVMREMSRASQGWNFTYQCRDSTQQWERQNKGKAKHIIAEYTHKEPDPAVVSRPAFDCRGSVKMSFSRESRTISVSYTHTPLHRTVAEIAELFRPIPREVAPPKPTKQKTPKTPGTGKKRNGPKSQNETGTPRKRKKKNNGEAQAAAGADEQPLGELAQNGGEGSGANGPQNGQAPAEATAPGSFPVNVTPEEAVRRREFAIQLLSGSGVDPDSLSTDQFNIFANQSPDLQKESLNMLVKYGAERLRIVHPSNRDTPASASPGTSAPPEQASQPTPSGPTTTKELVPQSQDEAGKGRKSRKMSKSRNACFRCKERKVKGLTCEYAPQKPRKKNPKGNANAKSEATVPADYDAESDDAPADEAADEGQAMDEEQAEDDAEEEADEVDEDHVDQVEYSAYPQVPVSDMLTPSADAHNHGAQGTSAGPYFQSASGLALPLPEEPSVPQQLYSSGTGLVLPQGTMYYPPPMEPTIDTAALQAGNNGANLATASPKQAKQQAKNSRRSLPSAQASLQARDNTSVRHSNASAWASSVAQNSHDPAAQTAATSMQQQRAASTHRSRGSTSRIQGQSPRLQDAASLSQAALEHQRQTPVANLAMQAEATRSASAQSAERPRAASRQAQRAQAGTPRGTRTAASAFQPPPLSVQQQPQAAEPAVDNSASHHRTGSASNMNSSTAFQSFGRYADHQAAPAASAERITYEPYSYQRTTPAAAPAYPAYDYGHGATQSATAAAVATSVSMDTMHTNLATTYPSHTTNPSALSAGSRASNNTSPNLTRSSYGSPQGFNARPAAAAQPARQGARSSVDQHQQQHQQQHQPQSQHNQTWYGFGGNTNNQNNNNSTTAHRGAHRGQEQQHQQHQQHQHHGYGWKMTDHWGNVS